MVDGSIGEPAAEGSRFTAMAGCLMNVSGYYMRACRGFQVLCLVSEVVQVLPSGQDPLHILGHNILDSLHLTLQVPNSVISGTPTGLLLDVNKGLIRPGSRGSKRPEEVGRTKVDFSRF